MRKLDVTIYHVVDSSRTRFMSSNFETLQLWASITVARQVPWTTVEHSRTRICIVWVPNMAIMILFANSAAFFGVDFTKKHPRHSMYGIFAYMWFCLMVNVGKYMYHIHIYFFLSTYKTIHWVFGHVVLPRHSQPGFPVWIALECLHQCYQLLLAASYATCQMATHKVGPYNRYNCSYTPIKWPYKWATGVKQP